jgi:hypothetical protein
VCVSKAAFETKKELKVFFSILNALFSRRQIQISFEGEKLWK